MEAGRLRKGFPGSEMLLVSQEGSPEMVQKVLDRLGADGYLLKLGAAELLGVIDAVLQGTQFLGGHLATTLVVESTRPAG